MIIIIILAVISFPIAIYYDSKKRIGKPNWGWMILGLIFLLAGVVQGVKQLGQLSGPLGSASIMGTILGVWLGTFAFYRIATRNKAKKYRERISKESEFKIGEPAISSDETSDMTISANQTVCDACKTLNPISAKFCQSCGNPIIKLTMVCPNCNTINPQTANYCVSCGKPLAKILPKSPIISEERRVPIEGPTKICPKCAETIKLEALICDYCGNQFSEEEVKAEKEKQKAVEIEKEVKIAELEGDRAVRRSWGIPFLVFGTLTFLILVLGGITAKDKAINMVIIAFILGGPFIGVGWLLIHKAGNLQREIEKIRKSKDKTISSKNETFAKLPEDIKKGVVKGKPVPPFWGTILVGALVVGMSLGIIYALYGLATYRSGTAQVVSIVSIIVLAFCIKELLRGFRGK